MSYNYGLSSKDLQDCRNKLEKQKNYLTSQSFLDDKTGEIRSLLDFSYSANLSTRYYPRILNKVHTFVSWNTALNYEPIFLTITLDGFFRDFLKGDFYRWEKNRENYIKHIPNNDRSGRYLDHIDEHKKVTTKDLYKILGHQLHRFNKNETFRKMKKFGHKHSYIRVTEPHKKDGVPHFHILLYVPKEYIQDVFREFKRFFPAPQNHKDRKDGQIMFGDQRETEGFQIAIDAAGGYILKYILKSFRNLLEEKELDYLQAWYVHNKIPRIITTHTLISQDVYHHASLLDSDWFYLTDIKLNDFYERDTMMNTFHFRSHSNREIIFQNGYYKLMSNGKVIKEFGQNKIFGYKFTVDCPVRYPFVPDIPLALTDRFWLLRRRKKYVYYIVPTYDIETKVEYRTMQLLRKERKRSLMVFDDDLPVSKMTFFDLFDLYQHFDFDIENPAKFALVQNRLVDLGLLDEEKVNLNDFNADLFPDFVKSKKRSLDRVFVFRDKSNHLLLNLYLNNYVSIVDFTFATRLKLELINRKLITDLSKFKGLI